MPAYRCTTHRHEDNDIDLWLVDSMRIFRICQSVLSILFCTEEVARSQAFLVLVAPQNDRLKLIEKRLEGLHPAEHIKQLDRRLFAPLEVNLLGQFKLTGWQNRFCGARQWNHLNSETDHGV